MPKSVALDAQAVATAVLTEIFHNDQTMSNALEAQSIADMVDGFLAYADVDYKPTSRKLVLTLDLSGPVEQQPDPVAGQDYASNAV